MDDALPCQQPLPINLIEALQRMTQGTYVSTASHVLKIRRCICSCAN